MADRGILFSAPMVRALLDGRKTQTRRMLSRNWPVLGESWRGKTAPWEGLDFSRAIARKKNTMAIALVGEPEAWIDPHLDVPFLHPEDAGRGVKWDDDQCWYRVRPPFEVGDRLWVREAWHAARSWNNTPPRDILRNADIEHAATARSYAEIGLKGKLRPGMFMPRWASRLTLTVTDVRVERLQDISEADAIAEGLEWVVPGRWAVDRTLPIIGDDPRRVYADLWNTLHDKPGERWEDNPWVVAINFDVRKGNIDEVAG